MTRLTPASFIARAVQNIKPWLVLTFFIPAVLLLQMLFVAVFPQADNPLSKVLNPFDASNAKLQAAFVYQNRTPDEVWGDFNYLMGSQLASRGQLLAAEKFLAKACEMKPNDDMAFLTYGSVLEALDKLDEARGLYEKTVDIAPDNIDGLYRLGMLQDRQGETPLGIETLQKALAIEPENAYLNYDIGVLYSKNEQYDQAAKSSKRAWEADEKFAEALNNYAYALANMGKFAESLEAVERSLELKPESAASIDTKGYALQGLSRYKEALVEYDRALDINPGIGELYLHKAQTLQKLNRPEEALFNYVKYLDMMPEAPDRNDVEKVIAELKKVTGGKMTGELPDNSAKPAESDVKPIQADEKSQRESGQGAGAPLFGYA